MPIDIHAHPVFIDQPSNRWIAIYQPTHERFHGGKLRAQSLNEFMNEAKEARIRKVCIFLRDSETKTGEKSENEWVANLAKNHSDLFIPFFAVDPNKGKLASREIQDAVSKFGIRGLKIHPYVAEMYPNDKRAYPVYEEAQKLGIPILFHSGPGPVGTAIKWAHPDYFDDVALDFPDLKIILAHFSGPWHMDAHALAWRHKNLYVDISFYPFSFLKSLPWRLFEETISDKILFGTDYPFNNYKQRLNEVDQLPISAETKAKILEENARKAILST